jgi:hypothetical protein
LKGLKKKQKSKKINNSKIGKKNKSNNKYDYKKQFDFRAILILLATEWQDSTILPIHS